MQGTNLNHEAETKLQSLLVEIEAELHADVLTLLGPIRDGVEHKVRNALEPLDPKRDKLAVVVHTNGGLVEVCRTNSAYHQALLSRGSLRCARRSYVRGYGIRHRRGVCDLEPI